MLAPLLGTVFVASLLGSVHCAAMCGGFVAWYAGCSKTAPGTGWLAHAAYHGGRLATYSLLGAAAGLLGAGLDRAGGLAGFGALAAGTAFALLVLWSVVRLLEAAGARLPRFRGAERAYAAVLRRLAPLSGLPRPARAGLVGASSTLLPCGWLYAFVLVAGGTGRVWHAILVMAVFWLGTVPMLLGIGAVLGRLRRDLPLLSAAAMLVVALVGLFGRVNVGASVAGAAQRAAGVAPEIPAEPPCHRYAH